MFMQKYNKFLFMTLLMFPLISHSQGLIRIVRPNTWSNTWPWILGQIVFSVLLVTICALYGMWAEAKEKRHLKAMKKSTNNELMFTFKNHYLI